MEAEIAFGMERFTRRWEKLLTEGDPYYNKNLFLSRVDFSIGGKYEADAIYNKKGISLSEALWSKGVFCESNGAHGAGGGALRTLAETARPNGSGVGTAKEGAAGLG